MVMVFVRELRIVWREEWVNDDLEHRLWNGATCGVVWNAASLHVARLWNWMSTLESCVQ